LDEGLIQAYIDGEASKEEEKRIESHIEICTECFIQVEEQAKLSSGIKDAIDLLAEEKALRPVLLRHESKSRNWFSVHRMTLIEIAASLLLVALFIFSYRQNHVETTPSIYYQLDWEVDANRPITDQGFVINVWEADKENTHN
jgi:predicted anti-sigma-YlaC factor YlaD